MFFYILVDENEQQPSCSSHSTFYEDHERDGLEHSEEEEEEQWFDCSQLPGSGGGSSPDRSTDESDDEQPDNVPLTLAEELLTFFILFNLPRRGMEYLLQLLIRHQVNVPRSVYLLSKSSSKVQFSDYLIENGQLAYLSIKENLMFCLHKGILRLNHLTSISDNSFTFDIKVNIDGLPLYRNSKINLWPILIVIQDITRPLPVSVFCGIGKPEIRSYMQSFVTEISELKSVGCLFQGATLYLRNVLFICDAPARAHVQCIKYHSGFYGCGYCIQKGEYVSDRVIFPSMNDILRTDDNYATYNENNQTALSPLIHIIPLFSCFPPDYMHLLCLGVMKKLCNYYFSPTRHLTLPCRLSRQLIINVNNQARFISPFFPSDFQRKPRSFSELENFKATEFRTLILYSGCYLFSNVLPIQFYKHFLLLHFSTYVFISNRLSHLYDHASRCYEIFVRDMGTLFGQQSLIYNVHVMLHLSYFVNLYGPLDNFSSFPYENHLFLIKRRVKKTRGIFIQTVNQLSNIRSIYNFNVPSLIYSDKSPNNCVLLNDNAVVLIDVCTNNSFSGHRLIFYKDLYDYPYPSRTLGIGFYRRSDTVIKFNDSICITKCICIPLKSKFLVIPFAN